MTNSSRRHRQGGNAMVEFALIGIPIMFTLIVTFELARGLWYYHTVAHAVREGTRFVVVHGADCGTVPNNCTKTLGEIAEHIRQKGVGLVAADLQLSFGTTAPGTMRPFAAYVGDGTRFPEQAAGARLVAPIEIGAQYTFRSPLGALLTAGGARSFTFPASSREVIQY